MSMFRFGCGHVKLDENIHEASWGARLIYSEVVGSTGRTPVVWDRQTPAGEEAAVRSMFPVIDRAIDEFRKVKYEMSSDSPHRLAWREGRVLVVMSPQASYGYLYITAVLEREGHEGETELAVFEKGTRDMRLFGNWPPEVLEARRQAEIKHADEELAYQRRLYGWALDDVRRAPTSRARTIRQKKADAIGEEIEKLLLITGPRE
jgi:hypothetical protein